MIEVAVFQVITELFVARNYGIAVACITPFALILSHLAARPQSETWSSTASWIRCSE